MNGELAALYAKLSPEGRAEVDALIYKLLMERRQREEGGEL